MNEEFDPVEKLKKNKQNKKQIKLTLDKSDGLTQVVATCFLFFSFLNRQQLK